ncbi:endonuclease/exonuclease/phosphatase family protein [Bacillus horti]|uniref:Endonuclease/exonuclease/phosphatase family metal-dependent hydrolase n=1 Tax=Caldalkalibacillus horti TaxID=77523 RepID=A0ABT9VV40_9BACI|nr:endonuclease/exonuclease/phosphatase family protein [Bacillus horti]MDQ0164856.1 endonuclease/exonuclease/phosphatase family metal-dependent hydrolase [Bacillus horti]
MLNKILKILALLVLAPVTLLAIFLAYMTFTDYKPLVQEELTIQNNQHTTLTQGEAFTVTTFNLGYSALDAGQDFFMDGGTNSRGTSKTQVETNLNGIIHTLSDLQSDIFLLQEVDVKSSRSYQVNQVEAIINQLPEHSSTFAYNYKVSWVPVPLTHPMGSVQSGLLTLSSFHSSEQTRFDLPGKESWPVQLFELDRAFIENRFPVDNGKELVLLNLHLSAFDEGGQIRKQQLDFLSEYIRHEVEKGNYMILGGDWNHSLPGTDPSQFPTQQEWPEWLQEFPETFGPADFQWAVDPQIPTVRSMDVAYEVGFNFLAVIDGFFVSPNIQVIEVHTNDLQFEHSDHHPVTAVLVLE